MLVRVSGEVKSYACTEEKTHRELAFKLAPVPKLREQGVICVPQRCETLMMFAGAVRLLNGDRRCTFLVGHRYVQMRVGEERRGWTLRHQRQTTLHILCRQP